jgi:hypothetical protein
LVARSTARTHLVFSAPQAVIAESLPDVADQEFSDLLAQSRRNLAVAVSARSYIRFSGCGSFDLLSKVESHPFA